MVLTGEAGVRGCALRENLLSPLPCIAVRPEREKILVGTAVYRNVEKNQRPLAPELEPSNFSMAAYGVSSHGLRNRLRLPLTRFRDESAREATRISDTSAACFAITIRYSILPSASPLSPRARSHPLAPTSHSPFFFGAADFGNARKRIDSPRVRALVQSSEARRRGAPMTRSRSKVAKP